MAAWPIVSRSLPVAVVAELVSETHEHDVVGELGVQVGHKRSNQPGGPGNDSRGCRTCEGRIVAEVHIEVFYPNRPSRHQRGIGDRIVEAAAYRPARTRVPLKFKLHGRGSTETRDGSTGDE